MKKTIPSRKVNYRVFLEEDGSCLLETKRDGYFLYEINAQGEEKILTSQSPFPYTPEPDQKEEDYYLDYLSAPVLRKIDLLTTVFSYQETIDGLGHLINTIKHNYSFRDFGMEEAYVIEDFKEIIQQLAAFTDDSEYYQRFLNVDTFFSEYFYNRATELSDEDKNVVITKLQQEINFLRSLSVC